MKMRLAGMVVLCGVMALSFGCKKAKETPESAAVPRVAVPAASDVKITPVPAVDPGAVLVELNGAKLTVGEADQQIMAMLGPQASQLGADRMGQLMGRFRQQAADRFVMRNLLEKEADRRAIKVTDGDVTEAIDVIKKRLPEGVAMADALQREGLTEGQFRTNLMSELRIKTLVESEVPTNMVVAEADVAKLYEEEKERFVQSESVQARHILIKIEKTDDDKVKAEKKAKIEALQKQLVEGADFAKLAKENSDCPSKERGGDLGMFQRGQMVKAFEDAAFTQKVKDVGPVVETMFGYHIIQVMAHEAAKTSSLEEVKEKLRDHLKQKKQMELFEAFVNKLKGQAKIVYSDILKTADVKAPMGMGME